MSAQQTLKANLTLAPPRKTQFIFHIDYKKMYHKVKQCNEIVLRKLEKAQRSETVWKQRHANLIDALWGWTTYGPKDYKTFTTFYPTKPTKEKSASASSFTFPPEREMKSVSQLPSSPTRRQEKNLRTPVKNAKRKAETVGNDKKESLRPRRSRKKLIV